VKSPEIYTLHTQTVAFQFHTENCAILIISKSKKQMLKKLTTWLQGCACITLIGLHFNCLC